MQMHGIIKQSASDRLPGGNHEVRRRRFHWTMPLYQFNNPKLNILNVHIHYVREDLFDLAVDLQLQRQGVHILPDKWHFNFQANIQNCSPHLPFKSAAPIINQ